MNTVAVTNQVNENRNFNTNKTVADELPEKEILLVSSARKLLSEEVILYIISTADGSVVNTIETGFDHYEADHFVLAGNNIFYYSWSDNKIKSIDFGGNITSYDYLQSEARIGPESFILTHDGSKIAWVETPGTSYEYSKLYMYDFTTGAKELLYEEHFDDTTYIAPRQWSQGANSVFFSKQRGEIGGYIIFGGFSNLYKLDVKTKTASDNLLPFDTPGPTYGTDIHDDRLVVFFGQKDDQPVLTIWDIITGESTRVPITNNEGFRGGGNGTMSPDGTKIVFNIAHWKYDDEHYRTMLYNLTDDTLSVLGDYPNDYAFVYRWVNNDMFIQKQKGEVQYIDSEGVVLKRFSYADTSGWHTYTNKEYGYSFDLPKQMLSNYGSCAWSDYSEYRNEPDHSYRPVAALTPVAILENGNTTYFANEYYYELTGRTVETDGVSELAFFSGCQKVDTTIESLEDPSNHYPSDWKIVATVATNDAQIESAIQDRFGSGCSLGDRTLSDSQADVYDIDIKTDGKDLSESDCPINYRAVVKYYPKTNVLITWSMGQAQTFWKSFEPPEDYDQRVLSSFTFLDS